VALSLVINDEEPVELSTTTVELFLASEVAEMLTDLLHRQCVIPPVVQQLVDRLGLITDRQRGKPRRVRSWELGPPGIA
jgi:hypothetical protein